MVFHKNKLEDSYSNMKYSVQMIQRSLEGIISIEKFYKVIIFDILIGMCYNVFVNKSIHRKLL